MNRDNPRLSDMEICEQGGVNRMAHEEFGRFAEEGFILLKQGQNIRDISQNYLNKLGLRPNIILETSNIMTAMNMVKAGMGVTFVPEAVLSIHGQNEGLCFLNLMNRRSNGKSALPTKWSAIEETGQTVGGMHEGVIITGISASLPLSGGT